MKSALKKIFILIVCGACNRQAPQTVKSIPSVTTDDVLINLSTYFSVHFDTVKKHMIVYDSSCISSINLYFYFFADNRNDPVYWNTGVYVQNIKNDNYHIFSTQAPGPVLENPEIIDVRYPEYIHENYFNNHDILSKLYSKNFASCQKLESVLNSMNIQQKKKLNSAVFDSLFSLFVFRPQMSSDKFYSKRIKKVSTAEDADSYINRYKALIHERQKNYIEDLRYQAILADNLHTLDCFKTFLDSNFTKGNIFVYSVDDLLKVISVNVDFNSNSLALDYYRKFSCEYSLYDIRLYAVDDLVFF